jgi:hypothetical protein
MATCDFCKVFFTKKVLVQLVLGFFSRHSAKIRKKPKKNTANELHESGLRMAQCSALDRRPYVPSGSLPLLLVCMRFDLGCAYLISRIPLGLCSSCGFKLHSRDAILLTR